MDMAVIIKPNLRGTESAFDSFLLSHTAQTTMIRQAVIIVSIMNAWVCVISVFGSVIQKPGFIYSCGSEICNKKC